MDPKNLHVYTVCLLLITRFPVILESIGSPRGVHRAENTCLFCFLVWTVSTEGELTWLVCGATVLAENLIGLGFL